MTSRVKKDRHLIIFSRAPIPGQVKTRMQPALSAKQCADLQQRLLDKTIATAHESATDLITLFCTPDLRHPAFTRLSNSGINLAIQNGKDLGSRMHNAFVQFASDPACCILIGTDCPELDAEILDKAFDLLESGRQCVINPATDGGYVLIGLHQPQRTLFEGISWGTSDVFEQTCQKINSTGISLAILPELGDIDTIEDLKTCKFRELNELASGSQLVHDQF
jgi:hypothetical protein